MKYNATGVQPVKVGSRDLLPDGQYTFIIKKAEETQSSKKQPMVKLTCEVVDHPELNGKWVFHNVTFLPPDAKGAGIAIHFLKCINQAWEGELDFNVDDWVGEKFLAKVITEEYNGKKSNKIGSVEATAPF